jgi:hypothetical protein
MKNISQKINWIAVLLTLITVSLLWYIGDLLHGIEIEINFDKILDYFMLSLAFVVSIGCACIGVYQIYKMYRGILEKKNEKNN